MIKEAAKRVRGDCLYLDSQGAVSAKLVLSSVSRALWFNNLSLAARLLRYSPIAQDLIYIANGIVCAHSYENFEQTFGDFHRVYHRAEVSRLQADLLATPALTIKKQIKSRLQCARRMQNVFWPRGKRLRLSGIKSADGNIVSSPIAMQRELIDFWGPVYAKKPIDLPAANTLLDIYGRRHKDLIKSFKRCVLPDKTVFCKIIKKVKDSAVGPDGIPYSAYSANIDTSSTILESTAKHFGTAEEVQGLDVFNQQFVWFPPKGEVDQDSIAIIRTAGNLRTIFGSNSDSKLIAGGIADALALPTFAITPAMQRGFCRGRQLSLNVVDIDTYMRSFNDLSGLCEADYSPDSDEHFLDEDDAEDGKSASASMTDAKSQAASKRTCKIASGKQTYLLRASLLRVT